MNKETETQLTSWEKKPTNIINVEGHPFEVSKLPDNIQFKIETLDKLKFEYLDLMFEKKKLDLAISSCLQDINNQIKIHFQPKKETTDVNREEKEV